MPARPTSLRAISGRELRSVHCWLSLYVIACTTTDFQMPCKFKREIHWNREKHEGHIFVGDRDNFKGYYLCVKRLA